MYTTLLKLFLQATENPILFLGLIFVVMASWGLMVSAIMEIAIRLFDRRG